MFRNSSGVFPSISPRNETTNNFGEVEVEDDNNATIPFCTKNRATGFVTSVLMAERCLVVYNDDFRSLQFIDRSISFLNRAKGPVSAMSS